ncbi:hypothetical protein LAG90_02030 [Marinilongibacter aquaticus]|uniref:hypothetical protein n=1 Tax=Marinilongibacter aquaticus TaxID=2975157 RepID=UPI0021BDC61A|nr:hypothetical protein [Marinilongibacter aquaticus]UBM59436.1 hypothetical protein LAG90_02030 [Marinilongibacter aquaticus]
MLKKEVLVSELSNLSDARYCAGMGVQFLSFELNENHPSHIGFKKMVEIKNWLMGPQIGGRLEHWSEDIPFDELQLDFLIINKVSDLDKARSKAAQVMLEVDHNELSMINLHEFDHVILHELPEEKPEHFSVFYAIEIDAENWEDVVESDDFEKLVLKGNHEERPGFSQYEQLMDVLEALEDE